MTLRITYEARPHAQALLRVEGSLAAEGAAVLEGECNALQSRAPVILDIAGVHFVDLAGIEALQRLSSAGVEILCRPGPVASVLEGEGIRVTWDFAP